MIDTRLAGTSTVREIPWTKETAPRRLANAWDHLHDICPGIGDNRCHTPEQFEEWHANTEARHEIHMIIRRWFTPKEREA